jgi:hypothetical protein
MKTKKSASELQSSYQAIVDSVEEFVVKEGKTLQQAFYATEEHLSTHQEHNKWDSDHARAIRANAEIGREYEKIMKNAEQDPSSEVFDEADEKEIKFHQRERQIHMQHSALHHELKTHHFKIMAIVNMLYKELQKVSKAVSKEKNY